MRHVLPWGGTTLLPNFMERFNADMKAACPRSLTFGLHQAPASDRAWMPALGGSVLTHIAQSLPEFWVTKAEYDEHGAGAVRRKCF
jgi:actin-related protein